MHLRRLALALALALAGCTSIGTHEPRALDGASFGPPIVLRLCALLDEGVTAERAAALLDEAWRDEGPRDGLAIRLAHATPWTRPAFSADGIMTALRREPLEPPCDRLVAFVGRHAGDVLWGLFLPQALGAVDAETRTRGYVVARAVTLDQTFLPPAHVLRHELYHMLGCDHDASLATCYERIATLKGAYREGAAPVWDPALGWVAGPGGPVAEGAGARPAVE